MAEQPESLRQKLVAILDRLNNIPVLGVLVQAIRHDRDNMCKDLAGSIAFYTFLSLFPVLLGIFSIVGFFLHSPDAQQRVSDLVTEFFPPASDFVLRNVESLVDARGTAGLFSILVLMWSGKKMVAALSRGINYAMGIDRPHAFYLAPIRNFALTVVVTVLVIFSVSLAPLLDAFLGSRPDILPEALQKVIGVVSGYASGILINMVFVGVLYVLMPYRRFRFSILLPGIVTGALLLELGQQIFSVYVGGVSQYEAVYGSVSSVIALMIWLYFSARVLLYGAEVIAVIAERESSAKTEQAPK